MTPIAAIPADLTAWSERQPKPVQRAAKFLDGWLEIAATEPLDTEGYPATVNVLACTARAVETLRRATGRA